jgi:predicted ester cyclase
MALDLKAITRRTWEEVLPAGDIDGLAEVVAFDCVNHDTPPGIPQGLEGITQTMLWLRSAFTDQRYEVHQVIGEGETVAIFCTLHARHTGDFMGIPPSGREIAYKLVHIVRYEEGKQAETWAVRDDLTMLRQLGALPGRPEPARS